jgi:hypothetical protein
LVKVTGYYPKGAIAALQELSRTMEVASFSDKPENGSDFNLTGQGEAVRITGSVVSANLFTSNSRFRLHSGLTFSQWPLHLEEPWCGPLLDLVISRHLEECGRGLHPVNIAEPESGFAYARIIPLAHHDHLQFW